MTPFSPEHARQTVEEVVRKLIRCPMNEQARKSEIRDLAWTLAQVWKKEKKVMDWVPASPVPSGHKRGEENA